MASASGDDRKPASGRRSAAKRPTPTEDVNPVASGRELGRRLRELRNELDLTVQEVGERLMCSATKISRLETGGRRAHPRDVRDLCQLYGVAGRPEADELMKLAREAQEPGWWDKYDEGPVSARLLGLEQEATAITCFSMFHVPGLLQTADYARNMIKGVERGLEPDTVDRRVQFRLRRQELLERDKPLRLRALLDEAVLHRQVGGAMVMQAQLEKLLACVRDQKAALQVIPFTVGAHASTDSNFDFLEFGEGSKTRPVVFVEGLFSNSYYERPIYIERYRRAIDELRDAAMNPRESESLILRIQSRHRSSRS